ncbi:hypothetical protein POM88_048994 [Heracleum sosnowskyi]|uniref:Alpha 1,4-glycosyltransferase domain-containing protein n=1 Tax=Heracleum sosnowskyi TaxID=360622 RepID=A0AAD8GXE5_9APIA|nr:hypothetical protein POM88_048994 [Heracleum sosnowskyi]
MDISSKFIRRKGVTPNLSFLFKSTPAAESWFDDLKSGNMDPGKIPLAQNLSNLIRLTVYYKYGGVYLDTDFIVLKDFSGLRNSIGAQSSNAFGNWTRWGHNGPYLVSRVASRFATSKDLNFTIFPPMAFYPIYWKKIEGFLLDRATSKWVDAKL